MPQPGQEAGGAEGLGDRRHGWGGGQKGEGPEWSQPALLETGSILLG